MYLVGGTAHVSGHAHVEYMGEGTRVDLSLLYSLGQGLFLNS